MENGFKHITSVSKPIRTAADLQGFRMRTPGGKLFVEFYKALGADPRIVGFNRLYKPSLRAGRRSREIRS